MKGKQQSDLAAGEDRSVKSSSRGRVQGNANGSSYVEEQRSQQEQQKGVGLKK
jgi:hypothetical protein